MLPGFCHHGIFAHGRPDCRNAIYNIYIYIATFLCGVAKKKKAVAVLPQNVGQIATARAFCQFCHTAIWDNTAGTELLDLERGLDTGVFVECFVFKLPQATPVLFCHDLAIFPKRTSFEGWLSKKTGLSVYVYVCGVVAADVPDFRIDE